MAVRLHITSVRRALLVVCAIAAALMLAVLAVWRPWESPSVTTLDRAVVRIVGTLPSGKAWSGSGTVIDSSGLVLTNAHIADRSEPGLAVLRPDEYGDEREAFKTLTVAMLTSDDAPAEPTYRAHIVAIDGYLDVAVLQIDHTLDGAKVRPDDLDLPFLDLGDSSSLEREAELRLIGYPAIVGNDTIVLRKGVLAGFQGDPRLHTDRAWILNDAGSGPGFSGAPVIDDRGDIVGLHASGATAKTDAPYSLERPLDLVQPVIEAARTGERYLSPYYVSRGTPAHWRLRAWAGARPDENAGGCAYTRLDPADPRDGVTVIWDVSGMAIPHQPIEYRLYQGTDPQPVQTYKRKGGWDLGDAEDCYWFHTDRPSAPGTYTLVVTAGRLIVSEEQFELDAAATSE